MPKKKIVARLSSIHGNGVFADEAIRKGERIVRYRGTLRSITSLPSTQTRMPSSLMVRIR